MNKDKFQKEINKELDNMSLSEIKELIKDLTENISPRYYDYIINKIKLFKKEDLVLDNDTLNIYNNITADFDKIEEGEIRLKACPYETGENSYFDVDVDSAYYPSKELKSVLIKTYNLMEKLVLFKEYAKVITLFELIINTNYTSEEVDDLDYEDDDYLLYQPFFDDIKDYLGIDLNKACIYAIYSLIMTNKSDKLVKILEYTKICPDVDIKDARKVGIEKIKDFPKFYSEWLKFVKERNKSSKS